MIRPLSGEMKIIVNTLLEVGDHVFGISKDQIITGVWYGKQSIEGSYDQYIGNKIADMPKEPFPEQCEIRIAEAFKTGENNYNEYTTIVDNTHTTYSVRILPCHPDKNCLFVLFENLSRKQGFQLEEDKWKLKDITAEKKIERQIEEQRLFYEKILNHIPADIAVFDAGCKEWQNGIPPEIIASTVL